MIGAKGYVQAIVAAVADRLDDPACIFEGRTTSWREMLDRAARVAGGLRARGIRSGDRVAVLSTNSDLYLLLYLAIPWAGAVLVPLNSRWSAIENAFALDDCGVRLLLIGEELVEANLAMVDERADRLAVIVLGAECHGWDSLDGLLRAEPVAERARAGSDLFAIFYTGGTTGRPKGVMLSHFGFVSNCVAMRDLGIAPDGCRMLVAAPLFHLAAAAAMTMAMLGGTAIVSRAFQPIAALALIADAAVSDALLVPTMIQMLLDQPSFDAAKLGSVERILYGASPMAEATLDRIMDAAPQIAFYQAYGMTEVSCTAAILPPEMHIGAHRAAGRHRGAGLAIATAELLIADADDVPCPVGQVGEILVRGHGVMLGYWNQPDLTAEALRGGWMHTGDGGRIDDHGILYVVDRLKDMIVSGGENVFSAEVEGAIAHHPEVAQCAVIGVPDPRWGERVHAIVVRRAGCETTATAIADHCRTLIAGYKCPRTVEFRQSLPLSPAGKVLKAELRSKYWKDEVRNVA